VARIRARPLQFQPGREIVGSGVMPEILEAEVGGKRGQALAGFKVGSMGAVSAWSRALQGR
jgi:hypothetical protein